MGYQLIRECDSREQGWGARGGRLGKSGRHSQEEEALLSLPLHNPAGLSSQKSYNLHLRKVCPVGGTGEKQLPNSLLRLIKDSPV